ncbi:MAG: hypothetical protein C7K11_09595 [Candidatus Amulumruptor caecigallinarius]|uniref:Uncharacterized protein n=1 Tax=Candidatus Amulumruptor caecigallinarius TaxID=2109911 RepID=A0A4V1LA45_9BACT|nr:MAG: hypothetical protein C7K11_09595 [Candidatus Amulumruptor caecigallinarius]HJE38362.1 hypothetical protein [Candidatus Amulumruptor caecigallinarius]
MNATKHYKFSYLGNYVINALFAAACLVIYWTGSDLPDLRHWSEMGVCCMGVWAFLTLWSRAFIATDDYNGKRILDARTTRALSCLLLIAEIFILMNPMTGSMDYLTAATALTGVWVAALVVTLFTGRLVKSNK